MEEINNNIKEIDWPKPDVIEHLIQETEDYIVYIDRQLDIEWQTSDSYDENGKSDLGKLNEILNLAAKLECIPSDHHTRKVRINYKRMIGEAIARSLKFDYVNASKMLDDALAYINERNIEKSRYWYLSASGVTAFIILTFALILWIRRDLFTLFFGQTAFMLILSSSTGAIGALLSVIMRLGKSTLNPAAGKQLHYLEGSFRIIAGCFSAVIMSVLIKLELILPIASRLANPYLLGILASIVSGASERWAPSMISRLDSEFSKDKLSIKGKNKEI